MAETNKGIYYPSEEEKGQQSADILNQFKLVAESVDDIVAEIDEEIENNDEISRDLQARQTRLEEKYDAQIRELANENPQLPEIVDARQGFNTLGGVIKQKIFHFDNVAQMKNCLTLVPGDVVETLGYYAVNDEGGAKYKIVETLTDIQLNNNLYAKKIIQKSNVDIVFMPVAYYENSNASGDCTVLYDKQNKQTLMIDTGALHSYSLIKAKLVEMGITHIDFFILSHFHDDHFENYQSLITDGFFDEDTVFYLPKLPNSSNVTNISQNVNTFKSALQNLDATVIYPTSETILNIGDIKISFFNCNDSDIEYHDEHTTDYNDYSICNYIEYKKNKILMTGDVQETAQKYLQENGYITKCDILKIPHHSWDTSGYNDFFIDANPRYAVASINAYQHNNLQAKNSKQIAILNAIGCDCYVLGNGEIKVNLNEGINLHSTSQKIQTKGMSSEYLIELYVDDTFDGEYCTGTKTNPFTNLSSALAYAKSLKNVRIDIYCNNGYSSNEELSIHDFRGLSIYNCSVNSMEIAYSEIGLNTVTLTGTKDRALLINLSKVLINSVTISGNNLSESHTGRGVGIYDSIVKVTDLSISNKKIALGLLDNSKVTIETLTGSNNNYLFSVSNNANYVCLTNSATYTTAETLVLSQNFNNAGGQIVYETRNSGNLNNLEAFASNIPRKVYISATNLTNQPVAANGWLTSYYQSPNTQVQIFIANSGNIYCRNKFAGTWQTWAAGQTVYETRNSGNLNNLEAFASNIPRKVYISATNLTNQPVAANGWLTSYYQSPNTQVQIFIANSGNIYCRNKFAGTWQTWKSITMS